MERRGKDGESAGWELNGDHVQRSRLRIDTRLKLLAKWNPRKYGDKLAHTGPEGGDIVIRTVMVQPAEKRETDRPPLTPEFGE